ncbi:hypothetical protein [Micromonospora sp. NPDC049240]|uniref:hypothetical protein n=1 Tax=Micromonospora sp. NPDC049240 TaxID=3155151 RepID=UPI0033E0EA5C
MKINGYTVFAVLPNLYAGGIDGYVIAAQDERGACVTARIQGLDATTWDAGNYFDGTDAHRNRIQALRDLPRRASVATENIMRDLGAVGA